jgi:nicotinate-nucleotide adenylyltransferase
MKKKIGLLFGSFNPIHNGHLVIAQAVVNAHLTNEVWMTVSPQNPFKDPKNLLNQYDRLHLVQLAVADNIQIKACDIEFKLPKPSYTIDTLTYLQERYPNYEFVVIMGEDNLEHFAKWKNHEKILKYYTLVVYPRMGYTAPDEYKNNPRITFLEVPRLEISATYIRQTIKAGGSVRYLVPDKVFDYIAATKLWS